MAVLPATRRALRRTDTTSRDPTVPKVEIVTEPIPALSPTSVLIKIHAAALNYRDANIANGGNPWPVIPHVILGNDGAGEILAVGDKVRFLKTGDRVAPINDTANLTNREPGRSWLAANEDGVLADYVVFDETVVTKLPDHLDWIEASIIPCAGTTAWSALKGLSIGQTVLIQGTGGVAMVALKLARHMGAQVILTSSSDDKLDRMKKQFTEPPLLTVNYTTSPEWHEEVLKLTDGAGVDLVVEVGGASSLIKSMKCTRRGGIVSVVGYLSKKDAGLMDQFLSVSIDRRVIVRGINAGSKQDQDDLCAALSTTRLRFDDIIDSVRPFEEGEDAIEYIWQGKQVGKVVLQFKK